MWLLGNQVRQSFSQPPVLVISRSERISLSDSRAVMLHYRLLGKEIWAFCMGGLVVMWFHSLPIVIIGCCLLIKFVYSWEEGEKLTTTHISSRCQVSRHRVRYCVMFTMPATRTGCSVCCFTAQGVMFALRRSEWRPHLRKMGFSLLFNASCYFPYNYLRSSFFCESDSSVLFDSKILTTTVYVRLSFWAIFLLPGMK